MMATTVIKTRLIAAMLTEERLSQFAVQSSDYDLLCWREDPGAT